MSYGMMVAVQLDHQTEFDRLWTWVKNHMAQGTGEIRWKCTTAGSGCAGGGAPDGEEYMATALIFASHRWGDSTGPAKIAYSTEAKWVLNVVRTKYFNAQYHLVKFVSSSNNVDPSYVLPAFYEVWACFDTENAAFWKESATAGRAYMQKVVDSNGVCPYQASMTATNPQAANADSTRCPVNLMMDWYLFGKDTWQKDTYAPKFGAYSSSRNNGGAAVGCNSTLGFALPASSGKAFVDKLWSTGRPIPRLLGRDALHARHAPRQRQLPHLVVALGIRRHEPRDGPEHARVDVVLGLARRPELPGRHHQRMVAAGYDQQGAGHGHARADLFQSVERAQGIPAALHEQHRRAQGQQHLVAQCPRGARARRRQGRRESWGGRPWVGLGARGRRLT